VTVQAARRKLTGAVLSALLAAALSCQKSPASSSADDGGAGGAAAGSSGAGGGVAGAGGGEGGRGVGGRGGTSGAAGQGGRAGAGGQGGRAGAAGQGGLAGAGSSGAGGQSCGSVTCAPSETCCSSGCNACVPQSASCAVVACSDGGVYDPYPSDCSHRPSGDTTFCGGSRPRNYICTSSVLTTPCTSVSVGASGGVFCCP
jgi:hypothetical protein